MSSKQIVDTLSPIPVASPSQPTSPPPAGHGDLLSARTWRYVWLVALGAAVGCAWVWYRASLEPVAYVSHARMFVSGRVNVPEAAGVYSEELANYLGTQTEIMRSAEVLQRARQRVELEQPGLAGDAHIDIRVLPQTAIFALSSTGGDVRYCRAFLDALMQEFILFKRERRMVSSDATIERISAELERLERQTTEQERQLIAFKERNNISYWEQQSVESARILADLKTREAGVRMRLSILDSWERRAGASASGRAAEVDGEGGVSLGDSSELIQARARLDQIEVEREFLLRGLRPAHPKVKRLDTEAERLRRVIYLAAARQGERRREQRLAMEAEIDGLQTSMKEWDARSLESSRIGAEYEKLKSSLARTRELYDRLLGSIQNLDTGKGLDQELVQILQAATPGETVERQLRSRLVGGLLTGALAGFGLLMLATRLDERSYSIEESVDRLGCRSLAEVPLFTPGARGGNTERRRLLESIFEEAFRRLRSTAALGLPADSTPVFVVTSALPSEGKSEIALNLARAFARTGKRVLLVDADLRRGRLHRALQAREVSPGVCELLARLAGPEQVIRATAEPNLSFVTAGRSEGHVNELLSAADLSARLDELRARCDVMILDSAPVTPVDDTYHLLPFASRVLFVVRMRHTPMRQARRALQAIRQRGQADVGLVFNRVSAAGGRYYYYNYAYHRK